MGEGVEERTELPTRSESAFVLDRFAFDEREELGGEFAGISDDKAVVGAAFAVTGEPDVVTLLPNGAIRPPLKDTREDELLLAREPGLRGDGTLGE